jgi:hypothetical protein
LTAAHVDALRWTTVPKGLPAAAMSACQHELLRALLETYVRRLPDEIAEREMAKVEGPSFAACASRGRAASSRADRTTTASRGLAFSWSTTTPRKTQTTCTPSGATRSATSAWTRSAPIAGGSTSTSVW